MDSAVSELLNFPGYTGIYFLDIFLGYTGDVHVIKLLFLFLPLIHLMSI